MTKHYFLVELGTEELPPKNLKQISDDFTNAFLTGLEAAGLGYASYSKYSTPRRIAVLVQGLESQAKSQRVEKRGPAKQACYDADGNLTKAAQGWLAANGISFEQASWLETDKGAWLYYATEQEGKAAADLLPDLVTKALNDIPVAKGMRWGANQFSFIRPVHTFTMLLDDVVLPGQAYGVKSDRLIYGHRFLGQKAFTLDHAQNYEAQLEKLGSVIPSFAKRRQFIVNRVGGMAKKLSGFVKHDDELFDEITALVEFPNVLIGNFDPEFLAVPKEGLIHTMEGDQRYFPVFADEKYSRLLPHFIFVSNINPEDPSIIIAGNEKVIRPRLTDAKFFYEQDLKTPLESLLPRLETAIFQKDLGTVKDKVTRLQQISAYLAPQFAAPEADVARASLLSKCDLMTNMVFEFTDMQGLCGMYYAEKAGETQQVSQALFEQYLPRFYGDQLPETKTGQVLAVADRLDTLVGIFGVNQAPKAGKDPYALRRAALGIIQILTANKLNLDLTQLLQYTANVYGDKLSVVSTNVTEVKKGQAVQPWTELLPADAVESKKQAKLQVLLSDIVEFFAARLKALYLELDYSAAEVAAVANLGINNPYDFSQRIAAVRAFKDHPAVADLAAANKRVNNFLAKSEAEVAQAEINPDLFVDESESHLFNTLVLVQEQVAPLYAAGKYFEVLTALAATREAINDFFDKVQVNAEDQAVRANRYALLRKFYLLFSLVADISALN